eukprot:CAMPEP_0113536832 /NCGR_PEP_ID=MMETSP0015_2-20120614/6483_1 /TAXON_ID=2838 /ORGANISM="Odontella" /LENGTH=166 /DNA_ID=CAMNT_0000436247 /DNA_START=127 /DNA_END=628 /DNA_ORIENTATION=+ /assembly_acc=CAM_ASM_000160
MSCGRSHSGWRRWTVFDAPTVRSVRHAAAPRGSGRYFAEFGDTTNGGQKTSSDAFRALFEDERDGPRSASAAATSSTLPNSACTFATLSAIATPVTATLSPIGKEAEEKDGDERISRTPDERGESSSRRDDANSLATSPILSPPPLLLPSAATPLDEGFTGLDRGE